jgi:hypothetical protein
MDVLYVPILFVHDPRGSCQYYAFKSVHHEHATKYTLNKRRRELFLT